MTNADKRARKHENKAAARVAREAAVRRARRRKALMRGLGAAVIVAAVAGIFSLVRGEDKSKVAATNSTASTAIAATTAPGPTTTVPLVEGCVDKTPAPNPNRPTFTAPPAMEIDPAKTYTAKISTTCGDITILLDAKGAPVATNNFVFLARKGFYDGLTWHRVAKAFVIQGGDPKGDGTGGPGYSVPGEAPADGYVEGAVAAAKSGAEPAGTMGSQFFVVTGDGTTLTNDYARFGLVTEGLDVAHKLESYSPGDGPPTRPLYMFKVEITES